MKGKQILPSRGFTFRVLAQSEGAKGDFGISKIMCLDTLVIEIGPRPMIIDIPVQKGKWIRSYLTKCSTTLLSLF